ncbi:hypothetical protein DFH11DRAFT_1539030 [Phellopilus nigrolimitatus]|nr:hypothetical protein DFH11DRAFT_1539030 [Phellopilus nigrolimitatus]
MADKRTSPSSDMNGVLPSEADLAVLTALVNADTPDEHADRNLAELLEQLERADFVARGVENRLDLLLGQLDGMVEGLETSQPEQSDGRQDETGSEAGGTDDVAASKQQSDLKAE